METNVITKPNIKQAIPFFMVENMEHSLRFYLDGLGFEMKNKWTPLGTIEWCWLQRDGAAIMLQEYRKEVKHVSNVDNKPGEGVSIWFQCEDALELYHEFLSRKLNPQEPFVGNGLWDVKVVDPDGYILHFESETDVPEGTLYSNWKK
ncbi:MAG TPA: VOC family protein [Lacibacter sp.]|nr:VOC family protein [Lacibacter sp.]